MNISITPDSAIKTIKAICQIEKRLADAVNTGGTGVINSGSAFHTDHI